MKGIIFLALVLLTGTATYAQDSVRVWNKWCAHKDTLLLFNKSNNVICVYSPTIKPADLKLKALDPSLRIGTPEIKGDTLTVMAMPYPTKWKTRLAVLDAKTGKTIKTVNFTSDSIPQLEARVGLINAPVVARKDILAQMSLRAVFPGSYYSYPYRISRYTLKVSSDKGSATINVNGYMLTKEVMEQISTAPVGTELLFTNIKATCPECDTRPVDDLKIKIR